MINILASDKPTTQLPRKKFMRNNLCFASDFHPWHPQKMARGRVSGPFDFYHLTFLYDCDRSLEGLCHEKSLSRPPFLSIKDMGIGIQYIQCGANVPARDAPLYRSLWLFHRRLVCRRYRSRWLVHRAMRRRYQSHLRECSRTPSEPHLMTLSMDGRVFDRLDGFCRLDGFSARCYT